MLFTLFLRPELVLKYWTPWIEGKAYLLEEESCDIATIIHCKSSTETSWHFWDFCALPLRWHCFLGFFGMKEPWKMPWCSYRLAWQSMQIKCCSIFYYPLLNTPFSLPEVLQDGRIITWKTPEWHVDLLWLWNTGRNDICHSEQKL